MYRDRGHDRRTAPPPEAWVQTDGYGRISRVVVGVYDRPGAWIAAEPGDIANDPDAMQVHQPPRGGGRE